jgi:hypothetical protein
MDADLMTAAFYAAEGALSVAILAFTVSVSKGLARIEQRFDDCPTCSRIRGLKK